MILCNDYKRNFYNYVKFNFYTTTTCLNITVTFKKQTERFGQYILARKRKVTK